MKGNIVSAWSDLGKFSNATKIENNDTFKAEGVLTLALKVRNNGLDLATDVSHFKWDGASFSPQGDQGKTADLLGEVAHPDAFLNLGITGLGELLKTIFEGSDPDATLTLTEGITPAMLPGIFGSNIAVSVSGPTLEEINITLKLEGTNRADWSALLKTEELTPETVNRTITKMIERPATLVINDEDVNLTVGTKFQGEGKFTDGFVTGNIELDKLAIFFNSLSFFGEKAPEVYDGPKGLGFINFSTATNDDGDASSIIGWTTPR